MEIKIDSVFKSRNPKKYIQVKTTLINNGTQIIAICSDITKIKEIEKQSQKMRDIFFSSVAHELRTPLNSIIPILRMILESMAHRIDEGINKYLNVILNSSIHLQNVIEDALDMSRIENHHFTIFKEFFTVKEVIEEVCSIMRFQVEQKGINLYYDISERVP